ncbi:T-Box Transcription Factor Tbx6 [Manis pentadactyla]|nr:T-Box Transcription Factor Tbx6 [Manis pentadactyla]
MPGRAASVRRGEERAGRGARGGGELARGRAASDLRLDARCRRAGEQAAPGLRFAAPAGTCGPRRGGPAR